MRRALASIVVIAAAHAADVTVERGAFLGWPDAVRVRNDTVEVVVVPAVGRVMRYALRVGPDGSGPDALWRDEALAGRPRPADGWANVGGDRALPWPQDDWPQRIGAIWPPRFASELAPHALEVRGDGVRLVSPVIAEYGVRIVRDIALDAHGAGVALTTTFEQVAPGPDVAIAPWTVSQVPTPDACWALADVDDPRATTANGAAWTVGPAIDGVRALTPPAAWGKACLDAGGLASWRDGQLFVQRTGEPRGDAERAQVFAEPGDASASPPRPAYHELEFATARRRLALHESLSLHVRWRLVRLAAPDAATVAALLAAP